MTLETLEKQIKKKAEYQVQEAITKFREALSVAVGKLFVRGAGYSTYLDEKPYRTALEIVAGICSGSSEDGGGWPHELWEVREAAIHKEIMSTMDTLQQVLLAKEPTTPPTDTMEETPGRDKAWVKPVPPRTIIP